MNGALKKITLGAAGVLGVVILTVAVTQQFGVHGTSTASASPTTTAAGQASTGTSPSPLATAPVRAPYGSTPLGTIGDFAVPALPPNITRLDDPRLEAYLLAAPPTVTTPGWAAPITDASRQDPVAFTKEFITGFYQRNYAWPRAAWASWVWDGWSVETLTPTPAYAAQVGQPTQLHRQKARFLQVVMAPTSAQEAVTAPASNEAWHKLGDLAGTTAVSQLVVAPIASPIADTYFDTDPAARTMDVRFHLATTVGGATKGQDLHMIVVLNTAGEAGGYGVEAMWAS